MKTITTLIFISSLTFTLPVSAIGNPPTVQDLLAICRDENNSAYLYCLGEADGVMGVLMVNHNISGSARMCAETFVSDKQVAQVFINWANKNPTRWQDNGFFGMMTSIMETWPCK